VKEQRNKEIAKIDIPANAMQPVVGQFNRKRLNV